MSQLRHRRQILLFLLAVIVPSMVLVAISLRMIGQERELAEKRLSDEQRRRVSDINQQLLTRLERIKLKQVSALAQSKQAIAAISENAEVALVGWQEKNQLVLPWDENHSAEEFQRLLSEPDFARRIHRGEQEELETTQLAKAADSYRQAMDAAHEAAQAAYARLLLARALAKSGGQSEAIAHYKKILALPSELVDEQDIPFSLYAAGRLLELGVEHQAVLESVRSGLNNNRWLPPTGAYILRDLANKLVETAPDNTIREAARQTQQQISQRIHELEQAGSLQRDFPDLKLAPLAGDQSRASEPIWVPYGEELWLVSATNELAGARSIVIAVRADRVVAGLDLTDNSAGQIKLITGSESKGESLGENFPGLRLALGNDQSRQSRRWNLQRWFYVLALLLVLSVTSFGAYLLWLDVRRESRPGRDAFAIRFQRLA